MRLTERQLNRTLLRRQLLVRRESIGVVEAVRRLVGLQAQNAPAPYVSLWNRVVYFDPRDLDAAFAAHRIVKATLLRITLHAVAAEDRPVFHAAMTPTLRAARLSDRRYLAAYGPATPADLAQFSTLYRQPAKRAFAAWPTSSWNTPGRPASRSSTWPGWPSTTRTPRSRRACWFGRYGHWWRAINGQVKVL